MVNKDLEALLTVQSQDIELRLLEQRAAELADRQRVLDEERAAEVAATERARQALERESARHGGLQAKVTEHRELQRRNMAQLDQVRRMREAAAAQAQVEMAGQMLDEEERELDHLNGRLRDLRASVTAHEDAIAALDERQLEARSELDAERAALDAEVATVRSQRDARAVGVPRSLLSRYQRIRDRRQGEAIFALRGTACSSCDTAIPIQRRHEIAEGGKIEVCEECGVLLYALPE